MKMPREDLLEVRKRIAEMGRELTPDGLEDILNEVENVQVVDEPGLVTKLRELRKDKEWRDGDEEQK